MHQECSVRLRSSYITKYGGLLCLIRISLNERDTKLIQALTDALKKC